ncbi:unnamed protein product [Chilo suppressalis]|uniref:Ubiquitin-like domain-containing protein n=1 Tax=Chilo suppressalis TaxID=168631 RepID=A0ABN8AUN9_CHISP|nr:hypothetical protein evm_011725 [Chilo suppressalis]CAH0399771.1 unnamed protein product [Chilo suppressalis]
MSLTKLIKAPIKLFRKDVISFLVIRRHDLGNLEDKLRYIAVKPTASISVLRQKIWHLLDLPDYCEEVIILKSSDDKEIPLTALRKGNDPHHPYILEVWMPEARPLSSIARINMLTLGNGESFVNCNVTSEMREKEADDNAICAASNASSAVANETMPNNNFRFSDKNCINNLLKAEYKSDITCRISSTSLFKINGKKNRDSFTNILLKIQSDLCTLSNKLSNLENRIPM